VDEGVVVINLPEPVGLVVKSESSVTRTRGDPGPKSLAVLNRGRCEVVDNRGGGI